jgi:hypothetical protein
MPGAFEYRQAEEIRDVFAIHGVRYLFIGKSGAILLGFPDTTQDADLFVDKSPANCSALVAGLRALGLSTTSGSFAPESMVVVAGDERCGRAARADRMRPIT